jgi:ribosomal-protein-alanine N-acetyltransferase
MTDMAAAPTIETERLILERLTSKFSSNSYVGWMNDPVVIQWLESGGDYTSEKLSNYLKDVEEKDILFWAIVIKESKKHIGNIKIDPVEKKHRRAEYGILMGDRSEWEKGYAFEASSAVLNFCFNELKMRKVTLGVLEENTAAVRLYEKLGFVVEGVHKDHNFSNGKFCNVIRMAAFNPALS